MTTTDTRPNHREAILDTALALMSAHGVAGMSMRRLATACGLQVAAIYHYFPSKAALLSAVVGERQYGTRLVDTLPIDLEDPPAERLRSLYLWVWQGALDEEAIWRLILGEGLRGESAVIEVGRDLLALVEAAASEWVSRYVPEVGDVDVAARLVVGELLAGFVQRIFAVPGSGEETVGLVADDTAIARRSADLLVAALLP